MFTAHQLHLPSDLRLFQYCGTPTYVGPDAIVFDGVLSPTMAIPCRSYLFFSRWLEVFITFADNLTLVADPTHPFLFAFNCDITTPYYRVDHDLFTTDVSLDLLVAPDGTTYRVEDADDFEQQYREGMFGSAWYAAAQCELADLIYLLDTQQFIRFLTDIAPFPTKRTDALLSIMERVDSNTTRFLYHPHYPRYQ